jgi:hypothetical protein
LKIEDNMINKFIKVTFVVVFAVIAGYGVYLSERKNILVSDLVNTNVLALADPESGSTCQGGGLANTKCPIWHITYSSSFSGPDITCDTGGTYKCHAGTCPHGK